MEAGSGKLFIGGIAWETNEDRLREYFTRFGEVVEALIMRDRITGRARGFGFILFADPDVAERVTMEKHMIDGRMVEAKKAVPRDDQNILTKTSSSSSHGSPSLGRTRKIFVGGLPSTITQEDFRTYFEQFGTITDVVVMYDHNTQRPRGFGFITYDSEDAVDKALYKTFHELNGKMVEVKRAVPKELSPGPNTRSPIVGHNYGLSRVNSFLNEFTQGYNPNSISGYGMRVDGRYGLLTGGRNSFPSFGPSFGVGMNFEPGISPTLGGSSNINPIASYGRQLDPYYNESSARFGSPVGYHGLADDMRFDLSSTARSGWGNVSNNYTTSSTNANSFMASGIGSIGGGFGNSNLDWGGPPISAHAVGGGSSFASGNANHGIGENGIGFAATSFGRSSGIGTIGTSFAAPNNGYEGNSSDPYDAAYGGSSIYGDSTWKFSSSEPDASGPFGYGLGNAASEVKSKALAGYAGRYTISNRQPS